MSCPLSFTPSPIYGVNGGKMKQEKKEVREEARGVAIFF